MSLPHNLHKSRIGFTYASEADLLNVALFDMTAKEWRQANLDKKGNIRDYATLEQLIVMANLESYNAQLIGASIEQSARLIELNKMAQIQMKSLLKNNSVKRLESTKKLLGGLINHEKD